MSDIAAVMPDLVTFRLSLPGYLVDHFEGQAAIAGVSFEQYMADHLTRTAFWTDSAPIYLNDKERAEIQKLLGSKVSAPTILVDMVRRLVSWKAGPHKIRVSPGQLEQLASYAKTMGKPLEEVAPMILEEAIAAKLQMR